MSDDQKKGSAPPKTGELYPKDKPTPAELRARRRRPTFWSAVSDYADRVAIKGATKTQEAAADFMKAQAEVYEAHEGLARAERRHANMDEILEQVEEEIHAERAETTRRRKQADAELEEFELERSARKARLRKELAEAELAEKRAKDALDGSSADGQALSAEEQLDQLLTQLNEVREARKTHETEHGGLSEGEEALFNRKEAIIIEKIQKVQAEL